MPDTDLDSRPELDDFGLLRRNGEWVSLSPAQEKLMRRLLEHLDHPVSREELVAELDGPSGTDRERSVDHHVRRLRRRIAPLGLLIHTIRGRGFLLAAGPHPT